MVRQVVAEVGPGQWSDVEKRFGLFRQFGQHRLEQDDQLAKTIESDAADVLHLDHALRVLDNDPGLLLVDVLIDLVCERHDVAHCLAELALLVIIGDGF